MTEPHRFDPFPGEALCRHCGKGRRAKAHRVDQDEGYGKETEA